MARQTRRDCSVKSVAGRANAPSGRVHRRTTDGKETPESVNSRLIRYFLAIHRHGSMTRAAKACGISQSAMTLAVERMERAVNGKLFERERPIRLTPLAVELLPLIKGAQDAIDRIGTFVKRRKRRGARKVETTHGSIRLN